MPRRCVPAEEYEIRKAAITAAAIADAGKLLPAGLQVSTLTEEDDDKKKPVVVAPVKKDEESAPVEEETDDEKNGVQKHYFIPILKKSDEEQTVTGVVLEPETVDAHGDIYDADVIRKAAFKFLANFNVDTTLGFMHKDLKPDFELCESFIAPSDLAINGTIVKAGSWVMTVKVNSAAKWKLVKEGKVTGFSIGGVAKVKKLSA